MNQFDLNDIKKVLQNLPSYNKMEPASRYRVAEFLKKNRKFQNPKGSL